MVNGGRIHIAVLGLAAALVSSATPASRTQAAERAGYLVASSFDILLVLPPAPLPGDARDEADRRIFRATRALLATPRGRMAANDVGRTPVAMLDDFACALGASLKPDAVPRTVALIERASVDTNLQKDRAKDFYRRQRPLFVDRGPVCQPRAGLERTFDYPSGHATGGWTWALILADLAPDRAGPVLARGRAFGESRAICGAHNASAVAAGWMTADATMALVRTASAFRADLEAARSELAAARRHAAAPDSAQCAAEQALVNQRVY
jgi:acid phosphatase (class A)